MTDPADALGSIINGRPRYVVSTTLEDLAWPGTTRLAGDPVESVRRLKARPGGELQLHGSARLAHALHDADPAAVAAALIDHVTA